jgi:hypothetical protein
MPETFTQWLIDHGFEEYVHDEGDGDLEVRDATPEDRPGELQSLFSKQYAAWLHHLMTEYGLGSDEDGDGIISVVHHQNDPDGMPGIEGEDPEDIAGMFGDRDDFVWLSAVNPHAPAPVMHERHYWDEFTPSDEPAPEGAPVAEPAAAGGPEAGGPGPAAARFHFSDTNIAFDLDGAAGNAAKLIGAAFGPEHITPELMGVGLNLFDEGMTMEGVAGLALGTSLFQYHAGGTDNVAFVNHVFENVVGATPSAEQLETFVGMLQGNGGTLTQAELLVLAAESDLNAQNIDLVGLQQHGVEFV